MRIFVRRCLTLGKAHERDMEREWRQLYARYSSARRGSLSEARTPAGRSFRGDTIPDNGAANLMEIQVRGHLDLSAPPELLRLDVTSGGSQFIQGNFEGTARIYLDLPIGSVASAGFTLALDNHDHELLALADEWKRTRQKASSSIVKIVMHPAYQRIIGKGRVAVPFILRELTREPDHWFWALTSITGEDPVPDEDRGDLYAMARAWIEWGQDSGYL